MLFLLSSPTLPTLKAPVLLHRATLTIGRVRDTKDDDQCSIVRYGRLKTSFHCGILPGVLPPGPGMLDRPGFIAGIAGVAGGVAV